LIGLAVAPALTRLYAPESFGIYSYVLALSVILVTVATLKFDAAIPLADDVSEDARRLTRLALLSALLFSLLAALLVAVFDTQLSHSSGLELTPWIWWLPPLVLMTSVYIVLSQAAVRERSYGKIATRNFVQSIGASGTQLGFAWISPSAGGLLAGMLFGRMLGIASLAGAVRGLLGRPFSGSYPTTIARYWRFPCIFTLSAAMNAIGSQLPLILAGFWFGAETVGLLGAAQRIIVIPAVLVGAAVAQVFTGELSKRLRTGSGGARELYLKTSLRLFPVGLLITTATLILSPWVFPLVLGGEWAESGELAQAMAASVGLSFVVGPVSYVFIAFQRTLSSVLVDLSRILLVSGFGFIAYTSGLGAVSTIWLLYLGQAINYAVTWLVGLRIASEGRMPAGVAP
jgi:O-antigen/teichoic acid export membrane protein